eukprot:6468230-Pyramimonas_sp.AAC.1
MGRQAVRGAIPTAGRSSSKRQPSVSPPRLQVTGCTPSPSASRAAPTSVANRRPSSPSVPSAAKLSTCSARAQPWVTAGAGRPSTSLLSASTP